MRLIHPVFINAQLERSQSINTCQRYLPIQIFVETIKRNLLILLRCIGMYAFWDKSWVCVMWENLCTSIDIYGITMGSQRNQRAPALHIDEINKKNRIKEFFNKCTCMSVRFLHHKDKFLIISLPLCCWLVKYFDNFSKGGHLWQVLRALIFWGGLMRNFYLSRQDVCT